MSTATMHPAAPHHLPAFITAPGETDYFYNGSLIFLIIMVIVLGTLYFRLHALPEHLAHGSENKLQFQLIGVLCLLALFTHNTAFWVIALVLALIRIPDLATPLSTMAESLSRMAGWGRPPNVSATAASEHAASSQAVDVHIPKPSDQPAPAGAVTISADPHARLDGVKVGPVAPEPHISPEGAAGKRRQALTTERA